MANDVTSFPHGTRPRRVVTQIAQAFTTKCRFDTTSASFVDLCYSSTFNNEGSCICTPVESDIPQYHHPSTMTTGHEALTKLPSATLKRLAFYIGAPLSGTKPTLASSILNNRIPASFTSRDFSEADPSASPYNDVKASDKRIPPPVRVLSIDMGIKNLAYCVLGLDKPALNSLQRKPSSATSDATSLLDYFYSAFGSTRHNVDVMAWKRASIFTRDTEDGSHNNQAASDSDAAAPESYTAARLAIPAVNTLTALLVTHSPTHIVIERQRHRSGGGPAVLEWTFRVNMLESMFWAVLKAYGTFHKTGGEGFVNNDWGRVPTRVPTKPIDPKKMNAYWMSDGRGVADGKDETHVEDNGQRKARALSMGRGEKAERIALARSWLRQGLSVGTPAEASKDLLLNGVARRKRGDVEKKEADESNINKVDDLADCLLQGVAYIEWERNKALLNDLLDTD